jgi:hypothetical protein
MKVIVAMIVVAVVVITMVVVIMRAKTMAPQTPEDDPRCGFSTARQR